MTTNLVFFGCFQCDFVDLDDVVFNLDDLDVISGFDLDVVSDFDLDVVIFDFDLNVVISDLDPEDNRTRSESGKGPKFGTDFIAGRIELGGFPGQNGSGQGLCGSKTKSIAS